MDRASQSTYWWLKCSTTFVATFSTLLWQVPVAHAVGSETSYPHVPPSLVRRCANNTATVTRRYFCDIMSECILDNVGEVFKANMAAGSAIMALLPTAVWLLAGAMEDAVSIARRDPWYALIVSFTAGGAKGMLRSGRPAEIDAGNWSADTELTHRSANAIIIPGLINMPSDSEVKIRFLRRELNLLQIKQTRHAAVTAGHRHAYLTLGWFLRLTSAVGTAAVVYLYLIRQDTCYVAFNCPRSLVANIMVAPVPALAEYLLTASLEYREYWTFDNQTLMCHTRGHAPLSARGAWRGTWCDQKRSISYWQNIVPALITRQPVLALVWKRRNLRTDVLRALLMFTRSAVYLFATVFFSALVLLPARQAVQIFMTNIGILLFNRLVLIVLDGLPDTMSPVLEVTVR